MGIQKSQPKRNEDAQIARRLALKTWQKLQTNPQSLNSAMDQSGLRAMANPQEIRQAKAHLLFSLRHHGQLLKIVIGLYDSPLKPKIMRKLAPFLILAATEHYFMQTPSYAITASWRKIVIASGLKNLSGLLSVGLSGLAKSNPLPTTLENIPDCLKSILNAQYGKEVLGKIAISITKPANLDMVYRAQSEHFLEMQPYAQAIFFEDTPLPILRLKAGHPSIPSLAGFQEGDCWVQDYAASLPARCFDHHDGQNILDLCAAPGGKTMQLAALGAKVTALDIDQSRLQLVQENLSRTKLQATIIHEAAAAHQGLYDAVLLDAPCSASGTLRRHPEIWLRLREQAQYDEMIQNLVAEQQSLLTHAVRLLKSGGTLIYAVCSLFAEEGEAQYDWFNRSFPMMHPTKLLPAALANLLSNRLEITKLDRPYLRTDPGEDMDGFFIAKWVKS